MLGVQTRRKVPEYAQICPAVYTFSEMDTGSRSEHQEPEAILREIWEAVRDRKSRSSCIATLKGRHGEAWIKQRYKTFLVLRDRGVREIAPNTGYSPSQADRNHGIYAPSELRRWLGEYEKRLHDEALRSLLTWHLRWMDEPRQAAAPPPPSSQHMGGLLLARSRVIDTPELFEPMRLVERYVQDLGRPVRAETAGEWIGPDPTIDQLRSHVPDAELWKAVKARSAAIETYEGGVHGVIEAFEADALRLTGMSRGYGFGHSGMDPSGPPSFLDGFLYAPFEHAFALLGGRAPGPFHSAIDQSSPQHPSTFKLRGGWAHMRDTAIGDAPSIAKARSALHDLDEQLFRSADLRKVWDDYLSAQSGHCALVARFAEIDEKRLRLGECWGC
jgi:hypothetical protein